MNSKELRNNIIAETNTVRHPTPIQAVLRWGVCLVIIALTMGTTTVELQAKEPPIPYDEAELFFEENATDGDLGIHFKVDGDGWKRLSLLRPKNGVADDDRRLLNVRVKGNLGTEIGLTEIFSESAEPSFDELPREDFLALFPAGEYTFLGRTIDGSRLKGRTILTHDMPDPAVLVSPEEDEEVEADEDLVIEWELVADPNPPDSVIEFYEVVVEKDEDDERLRVFSVHMLPTDTIVRCPAEFLEPDKDYKVEIIAQETSGNRTAIEVPFETDDEDDDEDDE